MDNTAVWWNYVESNACAGNCDSEGFAGVTDLALYCDSCGKPAVQQAIVRMEKSLKRHDRPDLMAGYAAMLKATLDAVISGKTLS